MGDMEGGSIKSGLVGLALIVAFLVCAIEFGGNTKASTTVSLVCQTFGGDSYECRTRP